MFLTEMKGSLPYILDFLKFSYLRDFAPIICPGYLFLCNKLLSNFMDYNIIIGHYSRFCGSEM